jgi:formylglycine-generating enzyme required for sulfatase activity
MRVHQEPVSRFDGHPDVVWIDGGAFIMGSDHHYPEERPSRPAAVSGFWIESHPVTNRQFAEFVEATGWITSAERPADAAAYPGAAPERLRAASLVFRPPPKMCGTDNHLVWWDYRQGADWRHPEGPESSLDRMMDHPVVHVALEDVEAYLDWAGMSLPTEAEWEFAARGGLLDYEYAWGDEFMPGGRHMANTWQGRFPIENTAEDGWKGTSPVQSYPPNGYGLYDMIGNVWEWTQDWWALPTPQASPCCSASSNPKGGERAASADPIERVPRRVLKGGSHLCAPSYCRRYRPAARHPHPIDTSAAHVGFRCIVRPGVGPS